MRSRFLVVPLLFFLVSGTAGAIWFYNTLWGWQSSAKVEIEIAKGSSARQILGVLEREGLAPSTMASRLYLRAWARGRGLHYGRYVFDPGMCPAEVLETVLDGRVEMFGVTIVEGSDATSIGAQFVDLGVGSASEWGSLIGRVDWIAAIAPEAPSLEGFLFPDTYIFAVGTPASSAARHLVERFVEVWSEERLDDVEPWGSSLETVTLASLVEAETSVDSERALIAGVYLNRLRRGMLLQCDPTVVYALKRRKEWSGRLYRIHWEVDDPYNTYRNPGLPPGPINSPGRAALTAALHPESTPYLYFVAKPGGGHDFSRTLSEHNRAVARWRSARR
jgi:UPF0755 protein